MRKFITTATLALCACVALFAQKGPIKGQILSKDDGMPLPGAVVKVSGSETVSVSDLNGEFSFAEASLEGKTIEVSYVGFAPAQAPLQNGMKIYLETHSELMDEVMVVAFGKQKKEAFTGSASVVSSADIELKQVTTPIEALNGTVTGLQMLESNSLSSSPSITIRGIGSLNASTSPLIVLDGMPYSGSWNDINPSDIASMTVLKDAASNALYGARGANGVILITTKSAGRNKTQVSVTARLGAHMDGRVKYDLIDNAGDYYRAQYFALRNYYVSQGTSLENAHAKANSTIGGPKDKGGLGYMVYSIPAGQGLVNMDGSLNPNASLGNVVSHNGQLYTLLPDDWSKEGLRNGFRQEYNVNLNGGNDKYSLYASLGYLDDQGLSKGSDMKRFSARLKTEYQAFSFLRIGANAGYTHSDYNTEENIFSTLMDVGPVYPLYIRDGDGNIMKDAHGKRYDYGVGDNAGLVRPVDNNDNYVQDDLLNTYRTSSNSFNIQGFAQLDFLKYFSLTVNGSGYVTESRYNSAVNPYYGYASGSSIRGYVDVYHYRTASLNLQQLLSYHQVVGKNTIDVLLGHEYSRDTNTSLSAGKSKVAMYDENQELAGAIVNGSMSSSVSHYNVEGFFLRAQWDYADRIFASASFRRDGSSNFHPKHRWGNFWSLGGAWIINKEPWFPKNSWLDMLKIKASYGEQGNDGIGSDRYRDTYSIKNADGEIGYVFSSKGNENITWETVGSFNTGVEFEFFRGRLTGGLDFYLRNTRDMLMFRSSPYSIGYSGYYDNVGDMRNTGIELELDGEIIRTKNVNWSIGLNLTWEKNRVTFLPDDKKELVVEGHAGYQSGYNFYGEGLPVNEWYMPRYAGADPATGESLFYMTNSDGTLGTTNQWSYADFQLCGSALPEVFGSFSTSLSLYGFDLNVQFNYSLGGKKWDYAYQALMSPPYNALVGGQLHKDVFKSWTKENPSTAIPRWQYNDEFTGTDSDRWLTSASFLTLKNVSVGYTLPSKWTEKFKVSKLRIYATMDNLYYWTARKGYDPRMGELYGNYNSSSGYAYPMRTISGGISISF